MCVLGGTALAGACFAITVPVGDTWAYCPHLFPSGCQLGYCSVLERLVKRKNFLPVTLVGVACTGLKKVLGGSGALGDLGRVPALCGGSKETARGREFVTVHAALCCVNANHCPECGDLSEREAWERHRGDPKMPIRSSTPCFPWAPGVGRVCVEMAPWEARQFFLPRAASRDLANFADVQCTLTNLRDTIFGGPFSSAL